MKTNISKIVYGPISIDNVAPNAYNEKKWQAQLRQVVTSVYPGARPNNSRTDALFPKEAFGPGEEYNEVRVTWVPVPIGSTVEQVAEMLAKHPNARLVKTLSLQPILSEEQIQAMENGISTKTMEDYKQDFVVDRENRPVFYKGYNVYRGISFRTTAVEDIDLRDKELADLTPLEMTNNSAKTEEAAKTPKF